MAAATVSLAGALLTAVAASSGGDGSVTTTSISGGSTATTSSSGGGSGTSSSIGAGGGSGGGDHLEIMAFYGMGVYNINQMAAGKQGGGPEKKPWITHLTEGLYSDQVRMYKDYKIPSFYGDLSSRYEHPETAAHVFMREKQCSPPSYPVCHLGSKWEETIEMLAERDIKPGMANGTLVGVFLGDELCCQDTSERTGMECWDTVIAPVADKFRALLGPKALIYTNECGGEAMWNSSAIKSGWKIPASLDIVSVDYYAGWLPAGTKCPKATKCSSCPSCPCFNTTVRSTSRQPPCMRVAYIMLCDVLTG
jgi:hypothetical protein